MKKLACFLLACTLLGLCACRRGGGETEQIYVDEGPEVVAGEELRDVGILFTAGLGGEDIWDYARLSARATYVAADFAWDYMALVDCGGALVPEEDENLLYARLDLMNYMGYTCAAVDAAELSGGVQNFLNYANAAQFDWLACNLVDENSGYQPLSSWTVMYYGQTSVAFVGVGAPEELPAETGADGTETAYSLRPADWYLAFRDAVDAAREAEVDYVIALGRLGQSLAQELIGKTDGLDAYLDGSGDFGPESYINDASGKPVLVSGISGGCGQAGKLTIATDGSLHAELLQDFEIEDEMALNFIESLGFERPGQPAEESLAE